MIELPGRPQVRSHWDVANELLANSREVDSWQAYKVEFKNVSLRQMQAIKISAKFVVSAKALLANAPEPERDPLDKAMDDMLTASSSRRLTSRLRKKSADPHAVVLDDSSDDGGHGSDSGSGSDSESAVSVGAPDIGAPGPAKPSTSFVWREEQLGIIEVEFGAKRKCRCYVCGNDILPGKHARGKYAYHTKRFHAYIHLHDFKHLEERFLDSALVALEAAVVPPEFQRQVEQALKDVRRKLKA